ncbi:hypothetical protein CC78DRAFT_577962 [Lojkania enalia]|uniref:KOW domain-containing protein n=1 Tax=Lojkania enalia TaxID=147567 RepID=A0A9P4KCC9_9PLEO|nr:hypothetical protein CC78DRAFT_577962 [Didymosphaeria enalia]
MQRLARQKKGIQKVKAAIRYAELENARKAPLLKQRRDNKDYIVSSLRWETQNIRADIKQARLNWIEDWKLGPLRPNRAVGPDAQLHGVLSPSQARSPEIPDHVLKKRVWPFAEGDRVVIIRGREENTIGTIREVLEENNSAIIKDTNKAWLDGSAFGSVPGIDMPVKREFEYPIPLDDLRLVTKVRGEDVIVDQIELRKYTSGVDPWDGVYKTDIPEEHQIYPENDKPIYIRYIAGTNHKIEWPWEAERKENEKEEAEKKASLLEQGDDYQGRFAGFRKAVSKLTSWRRRNEQPKVELNTQSPEPDGPKAPRAKPEEARPSYEGDTLSSQVRDRTFAPTLLYPPFPESVVDELRNKYNGKPFIQELWEEKYMEITKEKKAAKEALRREASERKKLAQESPISILRQPASMRTPKRVKWELEQIGKQVLGRTDIPQLNEEVLKRIGEVMMKNGIKVAESPLAERKEKSEKGKEKTAPSRVVWPQQKPGLKLPFSNLV